MCIEHRWAARQPAALPVSIACRSIGLLRGRLRNISNGGALVQLSAPLPANVPVEVILPVHSGLSARSYHLPAIVTRCSKEEIGLMFDRVEPETWMALLSYVVPPRTEDVENFKEAVASGVAALSRR